MRIKSYADFVSEDAGAFASLDSTPGMGAPTLTSRGVVGSGDIASPAAYNKNASSPRRNTSKRTKRGLSKEGDELSFPGMERLRKFWKH